MAKHPKLEQWLREHLAPEDRDRPGMRSFLDAVASHLSQVEAENMLLRVTDESHSESIERYRLAMDGTADGLWDWDMRGEVISYNKSWMAVIGFAKEPLPQVFESWKDRIHPADLDSMLRALQDHLDGHTEYFEHEHRLRNRQDRHIWTQHKGKCLRDKEGKPYRMVGRMSNIEARKRAEMERDRIFSLSTDLMSISDLHGNLHQVNPAWVKILGWSERELLSQPWLQLVHPEDIGLARNGLRKLKRDRESTAFRLRMQHKNGTYRWTSWNSTVYREWRLVYSITRDITKSKRIEEELIIAKDQALESVRFKEQFLANMSHEIRTPMNAVLGFAKLLHDTQLTEDQKEYVNIINTAGENLLVLINDILDLSKIEAGKLTIESIEFNLRDIITHVHKMLSPKAEEKGLDFDFTYSNAFPRTFLGDPVRITQIITNLWNNAIKFTAEGRVHLEVRIDREASDRTWVRLVISDTGIGIAKEQQETIFESFSQASGDTTRKFGGTGLGLTIVRRLLELLDGDISLTSEVGNGSTFEAVIPLQTLIKIVEEGRPGDLEDRYRLGNLQVLVVEDNKLNQLLAGKVLSRFNFSSDIAPDGQAALDRLKTDRYDLILMDVQMPVLNGYEATRAIRASANTAIKDIPIIAMTAHAEPSERQKCLELGMNNYISKPFDTNELYEKIALAVQGES